MRWSEDRPAKRLSSTGVDDWIEVPNSNSLDLTGSQITLSAFVKMTATQAADAGVIIKSAPSGGYNYQLGVQGSDKGNFRIRTETQMDATYLTGMSILAVDTWYYLAGVYDGTSCRGLHQCRGRWDLANNRQHSIHD